MKNDADHLNELLDTNAEGMGAFTTASERIMKEMKEELNSAIEKLTDAAIEKRLEKIEATLQELLNRPPQYIYIPQPYPTYPSTPIYPHNPITHPWITYSSTYEKND